MGGPEKYMTVGSSLRLVCVLRDHTQPPSYVFWYHDDRMINYHVTREVRRWVSWCLGGTLDHQMDQLPCFQGGTYGRRYLGVWRVPWTTRWANFHATRNVSMWSSHLNWWVDYEEELQLPHHQLEHLGATKGRDPFLRMARRFQ